MAPEKGWARYRDFVPEDIDVDGAGVMWLATERGGYAWDLASGRSAMVSPLADWYNNVNLATDGSVWFASMPDGHLARLQGTAWRSWSAIDGMPSSHIFATAFAFPRIESITFVCAATSSSDPVVFGSLRTVSGAERSTSIS